MPMTAEPEKQRFLRVRRGVWLAAASMAAVGLVMTALSGAPVVAATKAPKSSPTAAKAAPAKPAEPQRVPFTPAEDEIAAIPGMPDARFWADSTSAFEQAVPSKGQWLVLSGGGADGAFGAGLLNGLTQAGKRTPYAVISGVSSGALLAVFAFAGPKHDIDLRDNVMKTTAADIFEFHQTGESLLDTWPLKKLIAQHITKELLADVAAEHRQGRRLFVLTSNIDAQRAVVWNMGAIAAHDNEQGLALFRNILLASASLPGLFPPVLIDVEANGKRFQEMHVDGGIGSPLFVGPEALLSTTSKTHLPASRITLLVNGKLTPRFSVTDRNMLMVLGNSVDMGLKMAVRAAIARIYAAAQRQSLEFELTYIPDTFDVPYRAPFDQEYMHKLYEFGVEQGKTGGGFLNAPPTP